MGNKEEIRIYVVEYQQFSDPYPWIHKASYLVKGDVSDAFFLQDLKCDRIYDSRSSVANDADLQGVDLKQWKTKIFRKR